MKERQKNLFGEELEPVRTSDLVLRPRHSRPLTKAQQKFNRLLARVENLRKKLDRETLALNEALAYHVEHIDPRLIEAAALRGKIVRSLTPFLADKRLKKKGDRNALRRVIAEQLDMILDTRGALDEDLQRIFQQVNGRSVEQVAQLESGAMLDEMEAILNEAGVDVDLSNLRGISTEEEFAQSMAEILDEMSQLPPQERETPSLKSRNEEERARLEKQAEELRKKTVASIYKQLARVLHPDLEQDPVRREAKVALMQDLTAAYRANDLHTLLRLELEWIHREESDLDRLTDQRLAIYNQILKEQVDDLVMEIEQLPLHPRYDALTQGNPFFDPQGYGPELALVLDEQIESMRVSIALFESENAWVTVQELLRTVGGKRRQPNRRQ